MIINETAGRNLQAASPLKTDLIKKAGREIISQLDCLQSQIVASALCFIIKYSEFLREERQARLGPVVGRTREV